MKRENWPVEGHGIRPAGSPKHCFYCGVERGGTHKEDCVIRSKTVVVKATIEMVINIPEFWGKNEVEFNRNEGSWCCSNIIEELEALENRMECLCGVVKFEYLRDATERDEEFQHKKVTDLPT